MSFRLVRYFQHSIIDFPAKFIINSSIPTSRDLMVKLEVNLGSEIIFDEVELIRGQSTMIYNVFPDVYQEADEITVRIVKNTGYTIAESPNNLAEIIIEKPTIRIIDHNSPTTNVANGVFEFKVISDRFLSSNLPINLRFSTNNNIYGDHATEILDGYSENIIRFFSI